MSRRAPGTPYERSASLHTDERIARATELARQRANAETAEARAKRIAKAIATRRQSIAARARGVGS
jgi:hypothetical protein